MNALPCPFCGHAPEVAEMVLTDTCKFAAIECQGCGAVGPEIRLTRLKYGPEVAWLPEDYAAAVDHILPMAVTSLVKGFDRLR